MKNILVKQETVRFKGLLKTVFIKELVDGENAIQETTRTFICGLCIKSILEIRIPTFRDAVTNMFR